MKSFDLPTPGFRFSLESTLQQARAAVLDTPHGAVETPVFMPVGTKGSVKGLLPHEVEQLGARMILANTYHLWLRPGVDRLRSYGGLHNWMRWPNALLTDSGGYQVFSLASLRKIDDDGITFRSHLDGSEKRLTPEVCMRVQAAIASDIAMVLDECPPGDANRAQVETAIARSDRWSRICLETKAEKQSLFGIVQGGLFEDLRQDHLQRVASQPFDGVALGGFSVGEKKEQMLPLLAKLGPAMPVERPRYLMGVGTPTDLLHGIAAGIDMFDCVLPTRNGRNGQAFTRTGTKNLRNAKYADDDQALDAQCDCTVCSNFSCSYLRHLFQSGEMLGPRLVSLHNLHFYAWLSREARHRIIQGDFFAWKRELVTALQSRST